MLDLLLFPPAGGIDDGDAGGSGVPTYLSFTETDDEITVVHPHSECCGCLCEPAVVAATSTSSGAADSVRAEDGEVKGPHEGGGVSGSLVRVSAAAAAAQCARLQAFEEYVERALACADSVGSSGQRWAVLQVLTAGGRAIPLGLSGVVAHHARALSSAMTAQGAGADGGVGGAPVSIYHASAFSAAFVLVRCSCGMRLVAAPPALRSFHLRVLLCALTIRCCPTPHHTHAPSSPILLL